MPDTDAPGTPQAITTLRTTYRQAVAAFRKEKTAPLKAIYDQQMTALSSANRSPTNVNGVSPAQPLPPPFTNTLGMKFVPVPDTRVLFCIHETKRIDYERFCNATGRLTNGWRTQQRNGIPAGHEDDHPVVGVSWHDAVAFCAWLTQTEGVTHRLPTDHEWSCAVGIGQEEARIKNATPKTLSELSLDVYPWGKSFPPSQRVGNLSGRECSILKSQGIIPSYDDGFVTTAPVMQFQPNNLGIFDLEGNVSEWCEDWSDESQQNKVLRGGSWASFINRYNRSNARNNVRPTSQGPWSGFRVVVEAVPSSAAQTTAPHPQNSPAQQSFTNSLGMKFVPVPDTKVLVCIHETRRGDYAQFATATPGRDESWGKLEDRGVPVGDKDDHPVAGVSWDDAHAFCAWLSTKEKRTYRLPTDREWSCAVGIGNEEARTPDATPEQLNQQIKNEYPWGKTYPPPDHHGNLADRECGRTFAKQTIISNYNDGFATTAPVMSFKPNAFGIYDLEGNVTEWCSDWHNEKTQFRVFRGGHWLASAPNMLLSSARMQNSGNVHGPIFGFRVVLEVAP